MNCLIRIFYKVFLSNMDSAILQTFWKSPQRDKLQNIFGLWFQMIGLPWIISNIFLYTLNIFGYSFQNILFTGYILHLTIFKDGTIITMIFSFYIFRFSSYHYFMYILLLFGTKCKIFVDLYILLVLPLLLVGF